MKKTVLVGLGLLTALYSNAQSAANGKPGSKNQTVKSDNSKINLLHIPRIFMKTSEPSKDLGTGFSSARMSSGSAKNLQRTTSTATSNATTIGTTTYQLQSNASTRNALYKAIDGSIAAVYIYSAASFNGSQAFTDRGTAEVFFNDTTLSWSAQPSKRLEAAKSGWPNVVMTSRNSEVIVAHQAATDIDVENRISAGNGTFGQNTSTFPVPGTGNEIAWPRLVVGKGTQAMDTSIGDSNLVLHMINVVTTIATTGRINHQDGELLYSRSLDGGLTWQVNQQPFTLLDSADAGFNGFGGDNYAIDAKDSVVAIVTGDASTSLVLLKSMDAGTTWKKDTIVYFPYANYDGAITVNPNPVRHGNNLGGDTLQSSDRCYSVLIDNNHMVHVWYGNLQVFSYNKVANTKDDSLFNFVGQQLMYWNESMAKDSGYALANVVDYFHDGQLHLPPKNSGADSTDNQWGYYGSAGLVSHPSSGIDSAGNIYVAYDAVMSGTNDGFNKLTRGIYVMARLANGTWMNQNWPYNVDSAYSSDLVDSVNNPTGGQGFENVFPSMARNVTGGCVSLIYMSDLAAGTGVPQATDASAPNQDEIANNSGVTANIQYACISLDTLLKFNPLDTAHMKPAGIKNNAKQYVSVRNYPNPFSGITSVVVTSQKSGNASLDVYDLTGRKVLATENQFLNIGTQTFTIDASSLNPGVYFYTIRTTYGSVTNKMIVE